MAIRMRVCVRERVGARACVRKCRKEEVLNALVCCRPSLHCPPQLVHVADVLVEVVLEPGAGAHVDGEAEDVLGLGRGESVGGQERARMSCEDARTGQGASRLSHALPSSQLPLPLT